MEDGAVFLVQGTNEVAHLRTQNSLHRPFFRCHDVDLQSTRAECGSDLEADKARPDDHHAARCLGVFDDGVAIRQRTKCTDMWLVGPRDGKTHRFGSGCQQQPVVRNLVAARENDLTGPNVDVESRLP